MKVAKPLLKWPGSKRWFVKEFGDDMLGRIQERGGIYYEPFLGGASMALHLGANGVKGMALGDVESDLIRTYAAIRDTPSKVARIVDSLRPFVAENNYYMMRDEIAPTTEEEIAARILYLNRLCFNGLYRRNKDGNFNMAYGHEERDLHSTEEILAVSEALKHTELHIRSFEHLIQRAGEGDVVYSDPPYDGTYSGYGGGSFTEKDQENLAEQLYYAKERGAEIYCHNSDTDKVRYLYEDWSEIIPMKESRAINRDGEGRGKVPCVLIVGEGK